MTVRLNRDPIETKVRGESNEEKGTSTVKKAHSVGTHQVTLASHIHVQNPLPRSHSNPNSRPAEKKLTRRTSSEGDSSKFPDQPLQHGNFELSGGSLYSLEKNR